MRTVHGGAGLILPAAMGLLCLLAPLRAEGAVMVQQIDTFEDATVMGWSVGLPHPAPPSVIATGGPDGADDAFLQIRSVGGGGPGSRLAMFNSDQWTGDYLAAGVTAITLDLRNFGPSDATLRLRIIDELAGAFNVAQTTAVTVPAGSAWVSYTFSLAPVDLLPVLGDVSAVLQDVRELRLWHKPNASSTQPPSVSVTLGIDNIRAVPEPASALLIVGAGLFISRPRRVRRG